MPLAIGDVHGKGGIFGSAALCGCGDAEWLVESRESWSLQWSGVVDGEPGEAGWCNWA